MVEAAEVHGRSFVIASASEANQSVPLSGVGWIASLRSQ
jgi:hypothetical protein